VSAMARLTVLRPHLDDGVPLTHGRCRGRTRCGRRSVAAFDPAIIRPRAMPKRQAIADAYAGRAAVRIVVDDDIHV